MSTNSGKNQSLERKFHLENKNIIHDNKNHKENYYYDLAKKMVEIYEKLDQNYRESLNEEKENREGNDCNWKEGISLQSRKEILNNIIKIVYPFENEDIKNNIIIDLEKYFFNLEEEILDCAEKKSDYYKMLHKQIFKTQAEIRKFSLDYSKFERDKELKKDINEKYVKYNSIEPIHLRNIRNRKNEMLNNVKITIDNASIDGPILKKQFSNGLNNLKGSVNEKMDIFTEKQLKKENNINATEDCNVPSNIPSDSIDVVVDIEKCLFHYKNKIHIDKETTHNFNLNKVPYKRLMEMKNITFSFIFHPYNYYVKNMYSCKINKPKNEAKMIRKVEDNDEQNVQSIDGNLGRNSTKNYHQTIVNEIMKDVYAQMFTELFNLIQYTLNNF